MYGVAAHLDLLRRFFTVGEVDFLVGELGLYRMHPDLERPRMSHSIRVMRPVLQQLGISSLLAWFGTRCETILRFCRDGLTTIVPGVRIATHDRDRHCARGLRSGTGILSARLQPIGAPYHAAIRVNFDPLHRARRARKRQVATATDRLESDA